MFDLVIDLLITGLMLLAIYGIGRSVRRVLPYEFWSRAADVAFSFGFGAGIIASLLFGVSLLHLLIPASGGILLGVGLILAAVQYEDLWQDVLAGWMVLKDAYHASWFIKLMTVLGIAFAAMNLIGDLAPPIEGDTVHQYLLLPRYWVEAGVYIQPTHIWAATLPGNTMLISAWVLLLRESYSLATLVTGFGMSLFAALAVYALARLHFSRGASGLAVVVLYTMPDAGYLAQSAKVDMMWALFEILALAAFLRWIDNTSPVRNPLSLNSHHADSTKWLVLAGVFVGLAAGSKIQAFISVLMLGGWVVLRYVLHGRLSDAVRYGSIFAGLVVAAGFPFYLYNLVVNRSPFYPVFADQFTRLLGGIPSPRSELGTEVFYAWTPVGYLQNVLGMSLGHNPNLNFYLGFIVGPIFLLVVPVGILSGVLRGKRIIWKMLAYAFLFSVIWFVVKQAARHFLPGLALLSIVAGYTLWKLNHSQTVPYRVVLAASVLAIVGNIVGWLGVLYWNGAYRVAAGIDNRQNYLERWHNQVASSTYPDWETIEMLNTLPDSRILAEHANSSLYITPDIVSAGWGDRVDYTGVADGDDRLELMQLHEIDYILTSDADGGDALFEESTWLTEHTELIYDGERSTLYKIVYPTLESETN